MDERFRWFDRPLWSDRLFLAALVGAVVATAIKMEARAPLVWADALMAALYLPLAFLGVAILLASVRWFIRGSKGTEAAREQPG